MPLLWIFGFLGWFWDYLRIFFGDSWFYFEIFRGFCDLFAIFCDNLLFLFFFLRFFAIFCNFFRDFLGIFCDFFRIFCNFLRWFYILKKWIFLGFCCRILMDYWFFKKKLISSNSKGYFDCCDSLFRLLIIGISSDCDLGIFCVVLRFFDCLKKVKRFLPAILLSIRYLIGLIN